MNERKRPTVAESEQAQHADKAAKRKERDDARANVKPRNEDQDTAKVSPVPPGAPVEGQTPHDAPTEPPPAAA